MGGIVDNKDFIGWAVNFKYNTGIGYPEIWYGPSDEVSAYFSSDHGAEEITGID